MTQVTFTTNDKNILTKALKDKKNLRYHKRIQCVLFRIDGLIFRDTKAWIQKQNLQILEEVILKLEIVIQNLKTESLSRIVHRK